MIHGTISRVQARWSRDSRRSTEERIISTAGANFSKIEDHKDEAADEELLLNHAASLFCRRIYVSFLISSAEVQGDGCNRY